MVSASRMIEVAFLIASVSAVCVMTTMDTPMPSDALPCNMLEHIFADVQGSPDITCYWLGLVSSVNWVLIKLARQRTCILRCNNNVLPLFAKLQHTSPLLGWQKAAVCQPDRDELQVEVVYH